MMRAMRHLLALCVLGLAVVATGCGDDSNNAGPDMSMPDLAPPPDMSLNGVGCGNMTCAVGQDCCVTVGSGGTIASTCINSGGACAGGAVLSCDGPEDCSSSQFCCAMITFSGGLNPDAGAIMFGGGNASCMATCDFATNYPNTPTHVTTRLCHFAADCAGLSAFGQPLNQCCTSPQAPGLHFCGSSLFATCQ